MLFLTNWDMLIRMDALNLIFNHKKTDKIQNGRQNVKFLKKSQINYLQIEISETHRTTYIKERESGREGGMKMDREGMEGKRGRGGDEDVEIKRDRGYNRLKPHIPRVHDRKDQ